MSPERVVSADLAYRHYRDTGIAVLELDRERIVASFVDGAAAGLSGVPRAEVLAEFLAGLCDELGASTLLLDGPQAWKDPDNGLVHSRVCERVLHTPAKTGLPGAVKPGNYLPFVAFSIAVFDALMDRGWPRYAGDEGPVRHVAGESFPMSAWRSLGLPILPAKAACRADELTSRLAGLKAQLPLHLASDPNHDELQALVAGLAGLGMMGSSLVEAAAAGVPPFQYEGIWREGLIVNPRLPVQDLL